MENITVWIANLDKPLVLLGFLFLVFAGILKQLNGKKLSGRATGKLLNLGMILSFLLGLAIILFTFFNQMPEKSQGDVHRVDNTKISTEKGGVTVGDKNATDDNSNDSHVVEGSEINAGQDVVIGNQYK